MLHLFKERNMGRMSRKGNNTNYFCECVHNLNFYAKFLLKFEQLFCVAIKNACHSVLEQQTVPSKKVKEKQETSTTTTPQAKRDTFARYFLFYFILDQQFYKKFTYIQRNCGRKILNMPTKRFS